MTLVTCAVGAGSNADKRCVLFDSSYGERVPGSTSSVVLWQASSGWKVSQDRRMPRRRCDAVTVSAARNEAEAVQLVVSPKKALAELIAEQTGKTVDQIVKDSDRDRWFTAPEALKYGFIDKVITHESEVAPKSSSGSAGGKS